MSALWCCSVQTEIAMYAVSLRWYLPVGLQDTISVLKPSCGSQPGVFLC